MKLTNENIDSINYIESSKDLNVSKNLLKALLRDVEELNSQIERKVYIEYIDQHTEYSPERTDPCPDYFGMFILRYEDRPGEIIGMEMPINILDIVLCTLINFIEL